MDVLSQLNIGVVTAFQPQNILCCFVGVFIGTLIGVLPGIGPAGTIAILLPTTFAMPPVSAIIMLAGIYYGAMYGGSTTSILVNIPGESSSVVTCIDGYQMALQGRAGPALGISAFGSFIAGVIGVIFLAFLAPLLAGVAVSFGPPEYFSLITLGLTLVTYLGSGSMVKSLMMAVLGIILSCIGQDPIFGKPRLTYGIEVLWDGLDFIALIMGVFGISEVLSNIQEIQEKRELYVTKIKGLLPSLQDWRKSIVPIMRGTFIGFFLGLLPGGGTTLSTFVSYAVEKKFSKHPENFGKGAIEGVAGPESANNAGSMGAMVPLLTLGIPTTSTMALMLAALMIHGIAPGPLFIVNYPGLFWGVIVSMLGGNMMLLLLNLPLIGMWIKVLDVPYKILFPLIMVFCVIGSYSVNSRPTDVIMMMGFGWLGYLMRKYGYEGAPFILAFILGKILEVNLRQSLLIAHGSFTIFFTRPISLVFLSIALIFLLWPLIVFMRRNRRVIPVQ